METKEITVRQFGDICSALRGAMAMLRESAKQHRLAESACNGHAKMCDMHAEVVDNILTKILTMDEVK